MELPVKCEVKYCVSCAEGKLHRKKVTFFEEKGEYLPGECLHWDRLTMPVHSRNGSKYIDIFRDDKATYFWLRFRKDKGNLDDEIIDAIQVTRQDSGRDVKHIRCDNVQRG